MKPVLAIVAIAAVEEDVVLSAVAMEITIQENLSFFKKSRKGNTHRIRWASKCMDSFFFFF